jgi:hypothetical protein
MGDGTDMSIKFKLSPIHLKINFDNENNKAVSSIE